MSQILLTAAVLGCIGVIGAVVLYVVVTRFRVVEDPRIAEIEALLPGANCGACGRNGCHDFACACAQATSLVGLNCPGAGEAAMKQIAAIVGLDAAAAEPMVAVLRCNGARDRRRAVADYEGPQLCELVAQTGAGCYSCSYGCLGCGDCVSACRFGAMRLDPETRLPVVDDSLCTGCGECVKRCPKSLLFLRPRGKRGLRVWVACSSRERGAAARKECSAACIGCGLCVKACPFEAVAVTDNLALIDPQKCRLCRKCVAACPTGAIHTANFPAPRAEA